MLAVVNQKGGCGKTTTAINLAAVLARSGERTLLVDMDPQGHCAAGLGIPESRIETSMSQALGGSIDSIDAESLLWEVSRNLWLAPSTVDLAAFEATTPGADRDRRLERLLARIGADFRWCVIDCPPTIGLLTFNALRACHEAIVPVETGYFSLRGAERQVATVQAVASRLRREVPLRLLASMHREGTKVAQEVLAALSRRFPEFVIPVVVRDHEVLREAASFGQAIVEYAPESPAHEDFRQLVEWLRQNAPPAPTSELVGAAIEHAMHAASLGATASFGSADLGVGDGHGNAGNLGNPGDPREGGASRAADAEAAAAGAGRTRAAELAARVRRGAVPIDAPPADSPTIDAPAQPAPFAHGSGS